MASNQFDAGSWLDRALGATAALLLSALMLLTTVDVISRYLFNWPLRGAFEVTELLLLSLIFAGLPLASRAGEHVTLDFIDRALTPPARHGLRRLMDLVCGVILLGLAWRVWVKADKIAAYGDTTEVLRLPVSPFVYVMALMVAVTAVVHLAKVAFPGPDARSEATFDPDKISPT